MSYAPILDPLQRSCIVAQQLQSHSIMGDVFSTLNSVRCIWSAVRPWVTFARQPVAYAAGSFVAQVFHIPLLRKAAFVTYVAKKTLDWNVQLGHLIETQDRFVFTVTDTFGFKEDRRIEKIFHATWELIKEFFLLLFVSFELLDMFSISDEEAVAQSFCSVSSFIERYEDRPTYWLEELQDNLPFLRTLFPRLSLQLEGPEQFLHNLRNALGAIHNIEEHVQRMDYQARQVAHNIYREFDPNYNEMHPQILVRPDGKYNNIRYH